MSEQQTSILTTSCTCLGGSLYSRVVLCSSGGGGTSTRTVSCVNTADNTPASSESLCTASTKPASTQVCAQQGCVTYSWVASGFSACSVGCGTGVQTQTVSCRQTGTTTVVASSMCTGSAPPTSQSCNTQACPPPSSIPPHAWASGPASACSVSCGSGVQMFQPKCYRTDVTPNTVVDDSICADQTKPATQTTCNTQPCPTYAWAQSGFSACSLSCGGGTQVQTVTCIQVGTTTVVANSFCAADEASPPASRSCNTQNCTVAHVWKAGTASACSASCGGGVSTNTPVCYRTDVTPNTVVADSVCADQTKPPTSVTCGTQPCTTYAWVGSGFGACSLSCQYSNCCAA